ncbi:MAG: glycerol-3-phosphate dehydrogenase/oxidase [Deltaproteobacteria bacterium]|nr:glycerol-3-phosphate dehydrogenase/oxidase [Deltaproteobacteria bacterium]MCB9786439.1 glycerol-3-phosphate dehydrogenase/oxidase [Deltaproteobacteria bacterium]
MKLRQSNLDRLDRREFDVLIVGGGINGAVSASSLTSRGVSVALIDRGDFGGETSQESSNLIWGGIKYLESFELGLVRKLCLSRNHLIRSYPSNVREIRFLTTLRRGFRRNRFTLFLGALLYWLMGDFFTRRPRPLSARAIGRTEPAISTVESPGGFEYSDAWLVDNDARFVFRFVREALDHGGIAANYVEATGSTFDGERWVTRARDRMDGRELTITSRVLINACGPWVDPVNAVDGVSTTHRHVYSKGVHLIVDRVTEERRVLAFFADDGRLFFVIPMGVRSCIGTTDTRVDSPDAVVTPEDRRFILDNINRQLALPRPLTEADIIAERCGVRPLVVETGARSQDTGDWTSLSRKHAVELDRDKRHISVYGGKLTDCLNVGDEIAEQVRRLGVAMPYSRIRWYGEPPDAVRDEFFLQAERMGLDAMTAPESSERLATRLWRRYSARALDILEDIRQDPAMAEVLIVGTEYIRAEIHHAARSEMVTRLEDFLRRRSKIALVERTEVIARSPGLLEACRILFGADAQRRLDEYFAERDGASGPRVTASEISSAPQRSSARPTGP